MGYPLKTVRIKRRDGKPIAMDNHKQELCNYANGVRIAAAFETRSGGTELVFEPGMGIMLRGTGEVIPCSELWIDVLDPLPPRDQAPPSKPRDARADDDIPW